MFLRIVREARNFLEQSKRKTLMIRDIEASIKLVLVGDLVHHAINEGKRATGSFEMSRRNQPLNQPMENVLNNFRKP
jgi:hypothetical protein